jgi:hypothetical protein
MVPEPVSRRKSRPQGHQQPANRKTNPLQRAPKVFPSAHSY